MDHLHHHHQMNNYQSVLAFALFVVASSEFANPNNQYYTVVQM